MEDFVIAPMLALGRGVNCFGKFRVLFTLGVCSVRHLLKITNFISSVRGFGVLGLFIAVTLYMPNGVVGLLAKFKRKGGVA